VRAVYRNGIGAAGNVVGQRITTLADRPLGVSAVTNRDAATGGADPETTDSARLSIPLPLKALDRLVSVTDYADFSRTFAGIGKAAATALTNGRQRLVHVTVAGVDDIPLVDDDDVMTNLRQALTVLGDPVQPVVVARRELLVLVVRATVWLLPDYAWEFVEPRIRTALLDAFGFARQDLGQSVAASSVIATIQCVPGVDGVDLDNLASIPETVTPQQLEQLQLERNERIVVGSAHWDTQATPHQLVPAQVAALLANVPDTLMLVQR
jgi:predicted phage baseplate assembly protein